MIYKQVITVLKMMLDCQQFFWLFKGSYGNNLIAHISSDTIPPKIKSFIGNFPEVNRPFIHYILRVVPDYTVQGLARYMQQHMSIQLSKCSNVVDVVTAIDDLPMEDKALFLSLFIQFYFPGHWPLKSLE